jgi:hypothetical protein
VVAVHDRAERGQGRRMIDNKIYPIPRVPREIVEAVNSEKLAVFMGAGVSRVLGCVGWDKLAQNLISRCFSDKKSDGSSPCINFKEKEALSQDKDHKKIITICHGILEQNGLEDVFFEELDRSFEADEKILKSRNIYDELKGLRGLFITTNADGHFDGKFSRSRIVYKKEDLNPSNIDRTKLYHIHGSILDRDSLIFTVRRYIQRYNGPQFRDFLKEIFDNYVVLFVGYGMSEFELLDFLITRFDSNSGKELKHFILLPFYRGEENILVFEQSYHSAMGIQVLGYEKDERGYEQLYEVIRSWNKEINQTSAYLYDSYREIEDVIDNYDKEKVDRVFQIIRDKPQEDHFFKRISSAGNPFPWLKHLKERGYIEPQHNPQPQEVQDQKGYFSIPKWNVLPYLENVATQNAEKPNEEITRILVDVIDSIAGYRNAQDQRIENYQTDWSLVKMVSKLPPGKINKKHIQFIDESLRSRWGGRLIASEIGKSLLPRLIDRGEKKLLLRLIDVILGYSKTDGENLEKYDSVMDKYSLKKALSQHKTAIAKLCGIEAAKMIINKIAVIAGEDRFLFSSILIPTIEDHEQTSSPERYECQTVHFVRDMLELSKASQIKPMIGNLIEKEHPIFKRIAVHTINCHYEELCQLFWRWKGNPLDEVSLKHELYELLRSKCSIFSEKQIDKVIGWIESKDYYVSTKIKDDPQRTQERLAHGKKEWLSSLLETNNSYVMELYEKYDRVSPEEIEHPPFGVWHEKQAGTISPIMSAGLLSKSNEEVAKYLICFKEETGWKKPTQEGLSESFRRCVFEDPQKLTDNIEPFLSVKTIYQHALLYGFSEAWRAKKDFAWWAVLDFIYRIIKPDSFWKKNYGKKHYNYRDWIVSQTADLIGQGTQDDSHAFEEELLPQAEKILLILAEKTESDLSDIKDLVTSVLNSSKGKVFSAMVDYSLRSARMGKKGEDRKWAKLVKADFDKRLDRQFEPSLEFSVTLGKYLTNLSDLDQEWLIKNINRIFPKDDDKHWKAGFTGYLFYSSMVYKNVYLLLRENSHYAKALQVKFTDSHITEHLVQHICIGYLEGWERLNDDKSLISQLLKRENVAQLLAITGFFWMKKDKPDVRMKAKVKPLWKELFDIVSRNKKDPEYQKIASDLSKWLSLVDHIDGQILKWLKVSARYAEAHFATPFLIEYLLKHAPRTPKKVGEIYLEMLETNVYPDYEKEHIQQIVRILYAKGQKDIANRICNMYGTKGFDFLQMIYEEHRKFNS